MQSNLASIPKVYFHDDLCCHRLCNCVIVVISIRPDLHLQLVSTLLNAFLQRNRPGFLIDADLPAVVYCGIGELSNSLILKPDHLGYDQ